MTLPFVQLTYAQDIAKVKEVVDGETLPFTNGEHIRLIGVDTPDTKHPEKPVEYFGKEAYLFTQRMVERKEVRLEYDQTKKDSYNRILASVYLSDGTFLNAEIIKQGYGFAYTKYPFKYLEEFRQYERKARENKSG
jgi:micrococcal nuclease